MRSGCHARGRDVDRSVTPGQPTQPRRAHRSHRHPRMRGVCRHNDGCVEDNSQEARSRSMYRFEAGWPPHGSAHRQAPRCRRVHRVMSSVFRCQGINLEKISRKDAKAQRFAKTMHYIEARMLPSGEAPVYEFSLRYLASLRLCGYELRVFELTILRPHPRVVALHPLQQFLGFMRALPYSGRVFICLGERRVSMYGAEYFVETQAVTHRGNVFGEQITGMLADDGDAEDFVLARHRQYLDHAVRLAVGDRAVEIVHAVSSGVVGDT